MIKKSIYILLLIAAVAVVALAVINRDKTYSLLPEIDFETLFSKEQVQQETPQPATDVALPDSIAVNEPTTEVVQ